VIPQLTQRPAISVGKLKEVLAQVPDDHGLVPSQVYDFFVVDKDSHKKGYISTSGELTGGLLRTNDRCDTFYRDRVRNHIDKV
jgi:hypothetical protein